jgi:hypothetical protein
MDMLLILLSGVFVGYIIYKQENSMGMINIFRIYIGVFGITAIGLARFEYITWNIAMIMSITNFIICLLVEFFCWKLKKKSEK